MFWKEIVEWIKAIILALVLSLILKATVVQAYMIPTGSMIPTIQIGDRVFGNRFIYRFREPKRGEIVIFKPPASAHPTVSPYLKRIVGLPGDVITVLEGKVFINNKPFKEPYVKDQPLYEMPSTKVKKGCLFVMGDNRNNSADSHIWGCMPRKNLQAKAFFRFWPLHRIGALK